MKIKDFESISIANLEHWYILIDGIAFFMPVRLQKQIQKNNLCSVFKTYLQHLPASCARNEVLLVNGVETYIVEWRFYFVCLCSKYFRDISQQIVNVICK